MSFVFVDDSDALLLNEDGSLMYGDECCCEELPIISASSPHYYSGAFDGMACASCNPDTEISQFTLQFTADFNIAGSCGTCADWINTFNFTRLTQLQTDSLIGDFPMVYTSPLYNNDKNCWYACSGSLPCSADAMSIEIVSSNTIILTIIWPDNSFVRLAIAWTTDGSLNCLANFGNPGVPFEITRGAGLGGSGGPPCDFLNLLTSSYWSDVIITAM